MSRLRLHVDRCLVFLSVVLILLGALQALPTASAADPQPNAKALARVFQVQDRNTKRLLAIKGVVGTATGLDAQGRPSVLVFTKQAGIGGIPGKLEGVPVVVQVTGAFSALAPPPGKGKGGGGKTTTLKPTDRFPRPVPIGVSTGNQRSCSAGTISCRLTDGWSVYALSNNHVYALENNASSNDRVVQPGLYDTQCVYHPNNDIGTFFAYVKIDFSASASNKVDAAIATTSDGDLGTATPSDGYGTPKPTTLSATVGQSVQKYGRSTALTKGQVWAINATVSVIYSSGTARFVDQIVVTSNKPFIKAGDSGSLLVTAPGRNPVGLLFAGNSSGSYAIANRIQDVLDQLKAVSGKTLTIDDRK